MKKYFELYLLILYLEPEHKNIIFIGKFNKINDIIEYSNNLLKYSDVKIKRCKYITPKSLFVIHHVNKFNRIKYFS